MILDDIKNYGGNGKFWLIGDFLPSIIKTDEFEVGIHSHPANDKTFPHRHDLTKEINVILEGSVQVGGTVLNKGGIFVYEEGEYSDVEFLENTTLLVIRNGSFPKDKHFK